MPRVLALLVLVPALMTLPALAAGPLNHYSQAGVVVTAFAVGVPGTPGFAQATILDNGAAVCDPASSSGIGAVCIAFGDLNGDGVLVVDDSAGTAVAFQVCVDNNGDGFCGGDNVNVGCEDLVVFSHSTSTGAFYNPLQVPPNAQAVYSGCGSTGFPGYVVLICAGVHVHVPGVSHVHNVTHGTVQGVLSGPTGKGDFCGSPVAAKAYEVL